MHALRSTVLRVLPAAIGVVALAACTDSSTASPTPPSPPATTAPATSPAPVEEPGTPSAPPAGTVTVDWNDPGLDVPLPGGWSLRDCLGDAPMLCVHDGDELLGVIESVQRPIDDELAAAIEADGAEAALRSYVAEYHETFAADRAAGCADGYGYEEHPTELVTLAGSPALRYGFSGIGADGVEAERNISYVAVVDDQLEIVLAASNTEASCVYSETMTELTPAELRRIEPQLDALAAGSIPPG